MIFESNTHSMQIKLPVWTLTFSQYTDVQDNTLKKRSKELWLPPCHVVMSGKGWCSTVCHIAESDIDRLGIVNIYVADKILIWWWTNLDVALL